MKGDEKRFRPHPVRLAFPRDAVSTPPPPPPAADSDDNQSPQSTMACPLCGGHFAILEAWRDTKVACPHCQTAVTVPLLSTTPADPQPAAPPTTESQPSVASSSTQPATSSEPTKQPTPAENRSAPQPAAPEPKINKPLTANEREARRRRVNLMIALAGGLILVATTLVLSTFE